jgi:hypothetical protein
MLDRIFVRNKFFIILFVAVPAWGDDQMDPGVDIPADAEMAVSTTPDPTAVDRAPASEGGGRSPASENRKPAVQKRVSLNFDDEMVNGDNMRPDMNYLFFRKGFDFNKLIKVRAHFIREVKKSKGDFSGR